MRIVSLLPANTEMVCQLGLEDDLVGRSHECDFPPSVRSLPVLTASRVDSREDPSGITHQVRSLASQGQALYSIDEELLASLQPDLILTQAKCAVCAVDYDQVLEAATRMRPDHPPLALSFQPASIFDVLADLHTIGRAADVAATARRVIRNLLDRIAEVQARTAEVPTFRRRSVVVMEWLDPPMSCGSWQPEMIRLASGSPLLCTERGKAGWITPGQLAAADPDVLILAPCGIGVKDALPSVASLLKEGWFENLRAVREHRAWLADGNAYFNRPGPRLVDTLEMLSDVIVTNSSSRWRPDQLRPLAT